MGTPRWAALPPALHRELPQGVRTLQAGLVVNAFGNGAAGPFMVIYLHNARGIPLALAGLATATGSACALAVTLAAGSIADRWGPRPTMIGGLSCSALAFGLYPLVREPWHAFALAALTGGGIGIWLTMQSSLLAAITPPSARHIAFARQRVAANVGLGLGGFAGGLIVTTSRPATFTVLFWVNAATFVIYTVFLLRIAVPAPSRAAIGADYRQVLADHVFVRLALLNAVFVVAAVSLLNGLFPVYAKNQAHVSERAIGVLFLLNSLTIIVLQLPTARMVEGRRRMRMLAVMGLLFAGSWLLVATAGTVAAGVVPAVGVLVVAVIAFGLAECLYDAVYGPLVSDLAPPDLLGRYMAVTGFSWQFGFIVGPAIGGFILGVRPNVLWLAAAATCAVGTMYALGLERRLPERLRRTPGGDSP